MKRRMPPGLARLWAPWRMEYIRSAAGGGDGCFLCELPRLRNDRDNLILARGKKAFAILNRFPYNNGHLLVAPYRHVPGMEDLRPAEVTELWALAVRARKALESTSRPHGYNVGINLGRAAGAGLPGHIHIHIVPRWDGDTNFMPVLGDTKVLPMTLLQTWDLLAAKLARRKS